MRIVPPAPPPARVTPRPMSSTPAAPPPARESVRRRVSARLGDDALLPSVWRPRRGLAPV